MERLLLDIRHSPAAYLSSRGISTQDLVEELIQVKQWALISLLCSEINHPAIDVAF